MSRSIRALGLMCLIAAGCSQPAGEKLCIESDLGRYRFVSASPAGESGRDCLAIYQDPQGRWARVRVSANNPGLFGDGGVPAPFEKHFVFHRREGDGILVGWHQGNTGVTVSLDGVAVPQGPVLRAYLFAYRSEITAEVVAARQQVVELRQTSKRRPGDSAVHLKLARKYRKLGDHVMATQEYHISVEADRMCYPCYLEMATLYRELKHWDLAIRAARRAAGLEPGNPAPRILLGDVFFLVHNGQEALREYRTALDLGPDEKEAGRIASRIRELEAGKYMIEVLPGARKQPDQDKE